MLPNQITHPSLYPKELLMILSLTAISDWVSPLLAQQGGGAYRAGQIVGVAFLVILAAAILWRVLKR
jgi:hypothetical protein